jgi:hypothetical protein
LADGTVAEDDIGLSTGEQLDDVGDVFVLLRGGGAERDEAGGARECESVQEQEYAGEWDERGHAVVDECALDHEA